ncbi:MAG: hypothetical protein P8179_03315 [Candidatus Thiodiazotropha sp.]|jgi:hypothetical protein
MKLILAMLQRLLLIINIRDIRIYPRHLTLLIFLCLPSLSNATDIPAGWNQYTDSKKNAIVYQSSDADSDFLIKYYPAATLNGKGVDTWLRDKLTNSKAPKGKWQDEEEVALINNSNLNIANGHRTFINQDGSKGLLLANALSLDDQVVHLSVMIFSLNEKNKAHLDDAKQIIANLLKAEISKASKLKQNSDIDIVAKNKRDTSSTNNIQKVTPKSDRKAIEAAIRVAPGEGVELSDIEVVWVYSRIDLIWGGIDVDTYLLLKDGSVYRDCKIPPNELNVTTSKHLQPKKWSVWRTSWGDYQIKEKDGSWKDLKGGPAGVAHTGSKIAGKYVNAGGSQYRGSWKRTITFFEDGTFELSSFAMNDNSGMGGGENIGDYEVAPLITVVSNSDKSGTSGATSVIGTSISGGGSSKNSDGSKNKGHYQISDYAITMVHNNGWKHTELFIYEDTKDTHSFVYGNDMYYYNND